MTASVLSAKTKPEKVETGLSPADRKKIAEGLSKVLADTYVLLVKTHVYHWNVVGPLFLPIHELTEQHYNDLFEASDVIAERIRALGHPAPLAFQDLAPKSSVGEEDEQRTAEEMIDQLVADHEEIVRRTREIASNAEEKSDFVTHDMLVGRLTFHEKAIWMLRAISADKT